MTGGAGFIGSHVVEAYVEAGHDVVVVDDLSSGEREHVHARAEFHKIDIRDAALEDVFRKHAFDVVNHHAGQMDVRRSVSDPMFDASINIVGGLNVFECARKHKAKKIIFASTGGAIYGEQDYFPADEEHPTRPLSPYGISKLCSEKHLFYYKSVHGLGSVILRYANIYGPRQNSYGEAGVVAIFSGRMVEGEQPVINGDGKQTRDYTYVGDVVRANVLALSYAGSDIFNVGTGIETDVNTLFRALKEQLRSSCPERHGPSKAGEQMRSAISSKRIEQSTGWKAAVSLEEGLRLTAGYFKKKQATSL